MHSVNLMKFFITHEEEQEARKLKNTPSFPLNFHKLVKLVLSTRYLLERVTSSRADAGPKEEGPRAKTKMKKK